MGCHNTLCFLNVIFKSLLIYYGKCNIFTHGDFKQNKEKGLQNNLESIDWGDLKNNEDI